MTTEILAQPMKYLDNALNKLRDINLVPEKTDDSPIIALIERISDLDEGRAIAIARTLNQASLFNEVVREQISAMSVGQRYQDITDAFNSIRDDSKAMVDQLEDGKIDAVERVQNVWMKVSRGDIASRFNEIKENYLAVSKDSKDQIEREHLILDAYQDFRGALKQAEILALNILAKGEGALSAAKQALDKASQAIIDNKGEDREEIARYELTRDERVRDLQNADERYQIAKDLADNLTVSYNTTETIMSRLTQTTHAKQRVYSQAVMFFGTNESVLTALSASFTGLQGLHESTASLKAMKEGVSQSLEILAEIGGKIQEAAIKEGYGPTIRADAVKKLVDSIINYQEKSTRIIAEMRKASTNNANEIREAVEEGKQRLAKLASQGNTLN